MLREFEFTTLNLSRSKFARDYYLAGTKFTRLDALKDAMPFWSITGGTTTVSLFFFFCFIYYSEEKRKREREREYVYKYKRDERKQFQRSVAFFSLFLFFSSVVFQSNRRVCFKFFFAKEFALTNNRTILTPILREQSLFASR